LKLPKFAAQALELWRLPIVKIEMSGAEGCAGHYRVFTSRHPRWRLIQNKTWGVALVEVPERLEEYKKQTSRLMRRRVKRASDAGFRFGRINATDRVDEILAINRSAEERQGRPMHPDYVDADVVRRYLERSGDVYGVSDAGGTLQAYLCLRVCGEVAFIERLLGHADALDEGVMYLLIMGTIEDLIGHRGTDGKPNWFMYDMFSGASPGMRDFKHVIGCRPYRVKWSWRA
jgi:hypothetical protein